MATDQKKLRVWKCANSNCLCEFVVGTLTDSMFSKTPHRCPFCNGVGILEVRAFQYVINESKTELPDEHRTGTVQRRPLNVEAQNADPI